MNRRALSPPRVLLCFLLIGTAAEAAASARAATTPASKVAAPAKKTATPAKKTATPAKSSAAKAPVHNTPAPAFYGGNEDRSRYLPDTTVIARVGNRTFRFSDFISEYFYSFAEFRPKTDSLGRVEFLNTLINKNVLGLAANEIQPPLTFEDRARLRELRQRTINNTLFQRYVVDSIQVSEDEVRRIYDQYKVSINIRHIQFENLALAQRVRLDLISGRITWKDAVKRYTKATKDRGPEGELGWAPRMAVRAELADAIYHLRPGQTSEAFLDEDGAQLVQVIERRPTTPPAFESVRQRIEEELRKRQADMRSDRLQTMLAEQIHLTYDTTNVNFARVHFVQPTKTSRNAKGGQVLEIDEHVPEFTPADTARVVARFDGGKFTLGQFVAAYAAIPAVRRPYVIDLPAFAIQARGFVLEPYLETYAIAHGIDRDPLVTMQMAERIEQIRAEHLVQDSIESKVFVSSDERKRYFEKHKAQFETYESRDFALLASPTRSSADSLAARLRAGERAADILRADSVAGVLRGSIQTRTENDKGVMQKQLFQEMREKQVTVDGPGGSDNAYIVAQVLAVRPRRQMSYEESEAIIDESLQNMKSEALLNAFLDRHRKKYRIESHPELVMKIRLVDPTL